MTKLQIFYLQPLRIFNLIRVPTVVSGVDHQIVELDYINDAHGIKYELPLANCVPIKLIYNLSKQGINYYFLIFSSS